MAATMTAAVMAAGISDVDVAGTVSDDGGTFMAHVDGPDGRGTHTRAHAVVSTSTSSTQLSFLRDGVAAG